MGPSFPRRTHEGGVSALQLHSKKTNFTTIEDAAQDIGWWTEQTETQDLA